MKIKNDVVVTVRIPLYLYKEIQLYSKKESRTIGGFIRLVLLDKIESLVINDSIKGL